MPFEPYTGEDAWLAAVRALLPTLAAVFGPDVVVSQHGADSHAWDPLAHLRVTTTAMGEAARLVDAVAHRWAGGRWLATGGGGYDAYRVVPRAWALTWLAGAHREAAGGDAVRAWRERWEAEAAAFGTPGMPATFLDAPNAGGAVGGPQRAGEERSLATLARVRATVLPRLVREAEDRGWWAPGLAWAGREILEGVGCGVVRAGVRVRCRGLRARPGRLCGRWRSADLAGLSVAPRTVSPFDPADVHALLAGGARRRGEGRGGRRRFDVVGLAVAAPSASEPATESLLAVGVAPAFRGDGLGRALLRELIAGRPRRTAIEARVGVAERDVVEPGDVDVRLEIGRRLPRGAGFAIRPAPPDIARDDPRIVVARLGPG